ncbi:DUF4301 family protein [Porphyromonas circumdentaria]|uniref:DUF4301 family protein n=1 Tax=Porphyromonas circumdentaria TaxID=29524 RepID=UPI0026DC3717|nr:DUF4301 family protein [Porphyromonas circumdentaria]MDO4722001.1 DUF4301 family protein [Porphyromonas circumdentaria]
MEEIESWQENLFSEEDIQYLEERGISKEETLRQIDLIQAGSSYQLLEGSASLEYGIISLSDEEKPKYLEVWSDYCSNPQHRIMKFVPASGAASRMFKDLYPLLSQEEPIDEEDLTPEQQLFFDHINDFAFLGELSEACLRNEWSPISKLINNGRYATIAKSLLLKEGMNYGTLPKGLLLFHKYSDKKVRTAAMEHLVEAALYTKNREGQIYLHFTVSPEHIEMFKGHLDRTRQRVEEQFGVLCNYTFSIQSPSTDTLALTPEGLPFRTKGGKLLLRPGGHGALIHNLNELKADVIFIKNIDNVTPDHLKGNTILYKKLLGGVLVVLRERIFNYIRLVEKGKVGRAQLEEIALFLHQTLCIDIPQKEILGDKELSDRILHCLNRPLRICGMVRNEGEPGGGPYIVKEADGTTSLQILESSQIDQKDERSVEIWKAGTFFNPVDIVCSTVDYKGEHFNLMDFVNERTSFLSEKTYEGEKLISLERPGLWNGAMDKWNTLFVEVPSNTFTPVKTVNDLLRPSHQGVVIND